MVKSVVLYIERMWNEKSLKYLNVLILIVLYKFACMHCVTSWIASQVGENLELSTCTIHHSRELSPCTTSFI